MRPAAMDGPLSPPPRPLTFQARGGPSFGHSLSRPVSLEWAVRSGPCHCGQSNCPPTAFWTKVATVRASAMVRYIGGKRLDSDLCHVSRINQSRGPSLAKPANLLAKHAKQSRSSFVANVPSTNAAGERHGQAALVIITRVRFPSPAPLIIKDLRKSASKVQVNRRSFFPPLDHSISDESGISRAIQVQH